MKELEKQLKALANHRRLAILKYLKKNKEATVADIATEIKLSFKATSKHLRILSVIDIIQKEQRSSSVFYSLSLRLSPAVQKIVSLL